MTRNLHHVKARQEFLSKIKSILSRADLFTRQTGDNVATGWR